MTIKAIPTRYKGYHFRSRLEARWAVFFDALELQWEYEPEGFELPDGTRYLPDFLMGSDLPLSWVEIKGRKPTGEEISKADLLAKSTSRCVTTLYGVPGDHGIVRCGPGFAPQDDGIDATLGKIQFQAWSWAGYPENRFDSHIAAALNAARSARFEFGQSGASV